MSTASRLKTSRFPHSLLFLVCSLMLFLPVTVQAGDNGGKENKIVQLPPLEVQGTRNKIPLKDLPTSVTILESDEIKTRNHINVEDMIREEVGVDIPQNGGIGGTASPNLRGLGSSNTLMLIDGIQVNSNSLGSFDMSQLLYESTEQIEILRGTQSTVWGADAVGGVINIVSRSGQGIVDPEFYWSMEGGSFETFKTNIGSAGDLGMFDYAINGTFLGSKSISAAEGPQGNPEEDPFKNRNFSMRFGLDLPKEIRTEFIAHTYNSEIDTDSGVALGSDGLGSIINNSVYLAAPVYYSPTSWWDIKLNTNAALLQTYNKLPAFANRTSQQTYTVDLQNNFRINDYFSAVLGGEYQDQKGQFRSSGFPDETIDNAALYFQGAFNYDSLVVLTAGGRHDENDRFGNVDTYKIEAAVNIPFTNTRIRGARATGFRAPTMNQLFITFPAVPPFFGGFFGNPGLRPETSDSWEAGFDQSFLNNRVALSSVYFHTDIRDQISFALDPASGATTAQNNQLVTSEGFETTLKMVLPWNFDVALNHTWTDANNRTTSIPVLGVADHKFTAQVNHNWDDKLNTRVAVSYRGKSFSFGQPAPVLVPDFTVVRASLNYKYSDKLTFTFRGENVMDAQYQEIANFDTPGIAGYAGFKYYFHK